MLFYLNISLICVCTGCTKKVTEFRTKRTREILDLENQFSYFWESISYIDKIDKIDKSS